MTSTQAEHLLDELTSGVAASVGFNRIEALRYSRPTNDAIAMLSFPWRFSTKGVALFTMWIGLRFESLAQWLDVDFEMQPAIVQPIHLLREDTTFTEWEFAGSYDLDRLYDVVLADLRKYGLPFIERYSRLSELRKSLESLNHQDWFEVGLDVDRRVTTLAAIYLVEGDEARAIETLDTALLERKTALPKRRFAIKHLRKRLRG